MSAKKRGKGEAETSKKCSKYVRLVIDNNEKGEIKRYFQTLADESATGQAGPVVFRTLTLGDILFESVVESGDDIVTDGQDEKVTPIMLIERKTVNDLASSIQSKHFREQKARLVELQKQHPSLIIKYLVEGLEVDETCLDTNVGRSRISKKTLLSAILNTSLRDHFEVLMTPSVDQTISLINAFHRKFASEEFAVEMNQKSDGSVGTSGTSGFVSPPNAYLENIKTVKKENLTPQAVYKLQLSQIPGVSISLASRIVDVYPTMTSLVHAFEAAEQESATAQSSATSSRRQKTSIITPQKLLTQIDGIGKVLAERVCQYIYQPSDTS